MSINLTAIFPQRSIKSTLVLIIMTACIISVCLTTVAFMSSGIYHMKNRLNDDIITLAKAVGDRNAAALTFGDSHSVDIDLSLLSAHDSVENACIYDANGAVFATYLSDTAKNTPCPPVADMESYFKQAFLITHYDIRKKGQSLGHIYIKSNTQRIDNYIHHSLFTALAIILCIMLISYVIALCLQEVIRNPIVNLMQDTLTITARGDDSARVRKLHQDEIGTIVDTINFILEDRERRNKEFSKKSQELQYLSKKSEIALNYLNKELKHPFHAINSFQKLLTDQVFGPVHPMYIEYFNDVCSADIQLYCTIHRVMELYRLQSGVFNDDQATLLNGAALIDKIRNKYLNEHPLDNVSFSSSCENIPAHFHFRNIVEIFMDNLVSLCFTAVQNAKQHYAIHVHQEQNNNILTLNVELKNLRANKKHLNDNFLNIPLDKLTERLIDSKESPILEESFTIDFNDMIVRGKLYMLNFLSTLHQGSITSSLASNAIAFTLQLGFDEVTVTNTQLQKIV